VLEQIQAIRYVTPLREGGSLPGIVEADDAGFGPSPPSWIWRRWKRRWRPSAQSVAGSRHPAALRWTRWASDSAGSPPPGARSSSRVRSTEVWPATPRPSSSGSLPDLWA